MDAAHSRRLAYADYVAREATSELRHEFIDGEVFAMAGGTPEHSALIAAVTMALASLRGGPCRAFVTYLRMRIRADARGPEVGTYPDVAIVCGPVERDREDPIAITNPAVIIEVLSRSTEAYDRHGKFEHYQRLATLQDYILVSQYEPLIQLYTRGASGWVGPTDARPGGRVTLLSGAAVLDVDAVYDGLLDDVGRVRVA